MPLTIDSQKCETPVPADDNDAASRARVAFTGMFIGHNKLTDDTVDEWWWRITWLTVVEDIPGLATLDDLHRWKGSTLNVSPETRTQWKNRMVREITRDITTRAQHRKQKWEKEND
jgi:hypothetical protein